MADLASDWETVHSDERDPVSIVRKRAAAARIAAMAAQLSPIVMPLVPESIDIEPARGPVLRRRRR